MSVFCPVAKNFVTIPVLADEPRWHVSIRAEYALQIQVKYFNLAKFLT